MLYWERNNLLSAVFWICRQKLYQNHSWKWQQPWNLHLQEMRLNLAAEVVGIFTKFSNIKVSWWFPRWTFIFFFLVGFFCLSEKPETQPKILMIFHQMNCFWRFFWDSKLVSDVFIENSVNLQVFCLLFVVTVVKLRVGRNSALPRSNAPVTIFFSITKAVRAYCCYLLSFWVMCPYVIILLPSIMAYL